MGKHDGESGIVYCNSRNGTERLAARLKENGVDAASYHAGMDAATRNRNQGPVRDDLQVVRHNRLRYGHRQTGCTLSSADLQKSSEVIIRKPAGPGVTVSARIACCCLTLPMSWLDQVH